MTDAVDTQIAQALGAPIRGWDFSWLEGRASEMQPPWVFRELVRSAAAEATRLLDIDTGGGEFLASVAPFVRKVVGTEGYAPNVVSAHERLARLGIPVVQAESAPDNIDQREITPDLAHTTLPFRSDAFDLVVDRHSSYWPSEVGRVLTPGGRFLTQQRGEAGMEGHTWGELFERPPHRHERFTLTFAVDQLERAGFEIARAEEAETPIVFTDVAGVVYYLRLLPWAVEEFDPRDDRDAIARIDDIIRAEGSLRIRGTHMLVDARRL